MEVNFDATPRDEHGLVERDYSSEPVGTVCGGFGGNYLPRSEWPERIAMHRSRRSRPIDFHKFHSVPILNQESTKYCWAYSVVAGVMNRLAFQGINSPVPELSATAIGAVGMNYRNQGGFCSQAVDMIQKQGGVPNASAWPNGFRIDRSYENTAEVLESRKRNRLVDFVDLGVDLDAAISSMIDDDPIPVTFSLPWWRHAVLGLEVLDTEQGPAESLKRYGIRFVNSYGPGWGKNGYGEFYGSKMEAWEYIAVQQVKARTEANFKHEVLV